MFNINKLLIVPNSDLRAEDNQTQISLRKYIDILFIAFLLIFNTAVNASPCDLSSKVRRVYVRDFHAVGDGKTDDGPAIRKALKDVLGGAKPASLEFDAGKIYRVTSFEDAYALRVNNTQKVTLHGNGAELLLLPPNKVLQLSNSVDVNVCGLTIDYSPLPFTQGVVVAANNSANTFDLQIEPGFDVPKVDDDKIKDNSNTWEFGIPYEQAGSFDKRIEIKTVHAAPGNRQVRIVAAGAKQIQRIIPNRTHLVFAMPGLGQTGKFAFEIQGNDRVHVEGVRIYAVPQFSFHIFNNLGPIDFNNVEQRVRPGTNRVMTGWRDIFHVKDNRAPLEWNNCYVEGAFDDAFNLSAMYQLVVEKQGANRWRLKNFGGDEAPIYKVGDRLQAIDLVPDRRIIGETKITSVTQNGPESIVTLSVPLSLNAASSCGRDDDCGSRVVNLDAANEGSVIRNCTIHGSVRLRSKSTIERSKVDGFLQIVASPSRVGPLPNGIVIKDSELSGHVRVGSDFKEKKRWDTGERWAKDILFQNNLITSVIKIEGASISLVDNNISWPPRRKLELDNTGPVYIRNLRENGRMLANPIKLLSTRNSVTSRDIVIQNSR